MAWGMDLQLFINSHARTLDAKGRLMLPSEYREGLAKVAGTEAEGSFWLTGFYGRLVAYLPEDWSKIMTQLQKIPFTDLKLSRFKSKVMGLATLMVPDAQGRIRIPQPLMRAAHLEKDVLLVGMCDKFEIWDQASFDEIMTNEDISEAVANTGLEISL